MGILPTISPASLKAMTEVPLFSIGLMKYFFINHLVIFPPMVLRLSSLNIPIDLKHGSAGQNSWRKWSHTFCI